MTFAVPIRSNVALPTKEGGGDGGLRKGTVPHVVFIIEASDTNFASPKSATCAHHHTFRPKSATYDNHHTLTALLVC